ncbi:phage tail sheath subtilisin-like domain-containing protein [Streptomyces sp. TRM72054]|uniref:phage tail sheath family protein n=1 Tax=Streptomyces sp. TRM72054 TaxID=2870562 RepID=UPI001C8BA5CE|nr:phage tail sheath subtilisin-like domain-containing protein [Streptomyces sp. TRM72054]MBX9394355.1 phage tail sheath subtilisin-like domain-containing protein [Streptomyces sp. TRM72054]
MPTYLSPGVYVEEVSSGSKPIEGVGTAVGAFVGFTERGPVNEPVLVTNWTQFAQTFGESCPGAYLPQAVHGYFLNGGGSAYVVRIAHPEEHPEEPESESSGSGARPRFARALLPAGTTGGRPALSVRARMPGAQGDVLGVEVADATERGDGLVKLLVKQHGKVAETFDNVSLHKGPTHVVTVVNEGSKLVRVEQLPEAATEASAVDRHAAPAAKLTGGAAAADRPARLTARDFIGEALERTGIAGLEAVDDVTMLAVPDLMSAYERGWLDRDGVKAVQAAVIAHCELMADRVAILDTPPGLNALQVKNWRSEETGYDSKYATMYWPWLKVMDTDSGEPVLVPPSGHVAGVWARSDESRGVHKAPANEPLRGVIAPELSLTKGEHDQLNPIGLNCIRAFPGSGIRIWGARTLSSDAAWRYLNVRRLFNYVEESILQGTNWVVFEPNDAKLWDSVKRTITMFLRGVWRDGALFGRTPEDAFFVKCDEENNPPERRDQGILTVEVGIAAVKPAEFVVFRISQFSDGTALDE